jgi:hypothetical protein
MRKAVLAAAIAVLAAAIAFVAFGGLTPVTTQQQQGFISVAGPTGVSERDDKMTISVYQQADPDRFYGRFNYLEELETPGLDAPAGWIAGDRVAYRCAWEFLTYRDWIVGRVTYTSIGGPNADGARINDEDAVEGHRHYDGAPDWADEPNQDQFDSECENPPSGGGNSTAGPATTYPDLPATHEFNAKPVVFYHGPHDIEIRNFSDLEDTTVPTDPTLRLDTVAETEDRITLVGYQQLASGSFRARVEIHFDITNPGETVPNTEHPVELRTTLEPPHEHEPEPSPEPSPTEEPSPSPEPF